MKPNRVAVVNLVALMALAVLTAGCKGGSKEPLITDIDPNDGASSGFEDTQNKDGLPDLDIERMLFSPDTGLKPVYFDFDSSSLRGDALATLSSNAELIKQAPGVVIQVAGHCDERGTQEYNLALGERRALAVRSHLIALGVSGDRLITISYGEEFPAALGQNEAAWAKNRRCEFNRAQSY